jgi:hypothetical protein
MEAHDELKRYWIKAVKVLAEKHGQQFVEDRIKEVVITGLLTALLGPVGVAPLIIKGAVFVTTELVDMAMASDDKAAKKKPSEVVGDSEAWIGKPKDILEIVSESEKLPGFTKEIHESMDKTLGVGSDVMKFFAMAMEIDETLREEFDKLNKKLQLTIAKLDLVNKDQPNAIAKYKEIMDIATKLAETAPQAIKKYEEIQEDMALFEREMYGG